MKTLEWKQAKAALGEYARHEFKEPVILTDGGKPLAALVLLRNLDYETASLSLNPQFIALIERSRTRQTAEGGISSTEMRRRLGLSPSHRTTRRSRPIK